MDLDKALVSIQKEVLKSREKNGCKTKVCPYCHQRTYTINSDGHAEYCVNCGTEVTIINNILNVAKGEGVFGLCHKGSGGIIPIIEGKWEETLELLVDTVTNTFHIKVDDMNYCILHSIRKDKTITIDFKGML